MRIPGAGVKVNIQPLLAATEVPAGEDGGKPADETVVLAFVGATPTVGIDWTPRTEGERRAPGAAIGPGGAARAD